MFADKTQSKNVNDLTENYQRPAEITSNADVMTVQNKVAIASEKREFENHLTVSL
jgi:hypothetical protein